MPRIEVEEGHEEVEADGGDGADNEVGEDIVAELVGVVRLLQRMLGKLFDDDVECCEGRAGHDYRVCDDRAQEQLLRALRSVAHAEDELQTNQQHTDVPHYNEDELSNAMAERIDAGIGE